MRHAYDSEGHGWSDLAATHRRDTHPFDDASANDLISVDPIGRVSASVCLSPKAGD